MSESLALEAMAVTKRFGTLAALDGVNLAVPAGAVVGIIGPNGAGKTTLMRILVDIIRPTSGAVRVLGGDPRASGPTLRRSIGYLPGDLRLDGRATGRNLLDHFARISGPVASGTIDALAERLGLDLSRQVRQLSKGNRQKLGIIQAFMHAPRLLVLDEPTSGLDPIVQQEFLGMVRDASASGQTVLLSSHVLSEIQQAADTVAILRDGRVVTVSDVESLRLTAIRRVRARLTDVDPATIITALSRVPNITELSAADDNGSTRIVATVEGDIDQFIKTIATFTIADLAAEEPDLEESVLRMYSGPTDDGQRDA
jgi:ABC-2 type transport system ATP-binding protein